MPDQEQAFLTDKAVLWEQNGFDAYGSPTVGDPVEIDCRWLIKRSEKASAEASISATAVVDRPIKVGSKMWLGELLDWYGTGPAADESEVMQVSKYRETHDIKGRAALMEIDLTRFQNTWPEISQE